MEVDEYISEWLRWMIHKIMEVIREHMGQVCKSQLQTGTNWHLPGTLASKGTTKTWAFAICLCCCICWPSTPPAGNSGYRVRHPVLQRNWWNRSLERYFGELILGSQSLYLLVSRKALNPNLSLPPSPSGLPWWLSGKESAWKSGDMGLIPELGRSPGGKNGYSLQYSCLGNPIDRGAWWGHKRVRDFLATKQQSFPLITMFVFYVCGLVLLYK